MARRRRHTDPAAYLLVAVLAGGLVLSQAIRLARSHVAAAAGIAACVLGVSVIGVVLWWRWRRRCRERDRARVIELLRLGEMTPAEFEQALAALCIRDGCRSAEVVGGAGDLGADVIAKAADGKRIVLQAKRYRRDRSVGSPDLQKFGGTCFSVHHADIAAVVTTAGRFTPAAVSYASGMGIRLFDNQKLSAWASQTGPPPWQ